MTWSGKPAGARRPARRPTELTKAVCVAQATTALCGVVAVASNRPNSTTASPAAPASAGHDPGRQPCPDDQAKSLLARIARRAFGMRLRHWPSSQRVEIGGDVPRLLVAEVDVGHGVARQHRLRGAHPPDQVRRAYWAESRRSWCGARSGRAADRPCRRPAAGRGSRGSRRSSPVVITIAPRFGSPPKLGRLRRLGADRWHPATSTAHTASSGAPR